MSLTPTSWCWRNLIKSTLFSRILFFFFFISFLFLTYWPLLHSHLSDFHLFLLFVRRYFCDNLGILLTRFSNSYLWLFSQNKRNSLLRCWDEVLLCIYFKTRIFIFFINVLFGLVYSSPFDYSQRVSCYNKSCRQLVPSSHISPLV